MCITLYKLYACNCRYPQTVKPCPMMDTALDLVDLDGIPESDPRVQRLEDQCDDKAATRYETQPDVCEPCRAAIAAVGMEAWSVAREERDREVEEGWFREMERNGRVAMAKQSKRSLRGKRRGSAKVDARGYKSFGGDVAVVGGAKLGNVEMAMGAMRFLRDDDLVDVPSSSRAQVGKGTIPTPENDVMTYLDASNDDDAAVDPGGLRNALREVLGSGGNMQGSYGEGSIYDADDDMLNVQYSTDAGASRSSAPSPGRER